MEYPPAIARSLPSAEDIVKLSTGVWTLRGEKHHVAVAKRPSGNAPIKLLLQLEGGAEIRQSGRRLTLAPQQFTIIDGARPFAADMQGRFAQVLVALPRSAVLRRHRGIEGCAASPFGQEGGEALVRDFMLSLGRQAHRLSSAALLRAKAVLADLVGGLDKGDQGDASTSLFQRAMALINLDVADLDAEGLAARLGMSRRYLDALFVQSGRTVSQHLWERRLQLAAERLRCPEPSRITEISHSVGFKDSSHFSRAFRKRFGATPREWRRRAGLRTSAET